MIKEVGLKFRFDNNSFKDGNLLIYDKNGEYFCSVSPEQFLSHQNIEIARLKKEYQQKALDMEKKVDELEKRYEEFLTNYKENNAKLLAMVESFIQKYGGENK